MPCHQGDQSDVQRLYTIGDAKCDSLDESSSTEIGEAISGWTRFMLFERGGLIMS